MQIHLQKPAAKVQLFQILTKELQEHFQIWNNRALKDCLTSVRKWSHERS